MADSDLKAGSHALNAVNPASVISASEGEGPESYTLPALGLRPLQLR